MIKKITLASIATMALLFIPAQAENTKCQAGKCGAGMKSTSTADKKVSLSNNACKWKNKKMSVSLVKRLPNLMLIISRHENDPKLALSDEQKTKLQIARKERMPVMSKLKDDAFALKKEIAQASMSGTKSTDLKVQVEKLAAVQAEATLLKLRCIDETKEILSQEQMAYIKELRQAKKAKMKTKMKKMKGQKGMGAMNKGVNCECKGCPGANK